MNKKRKLAIVNIKGGFGNQLFQFSLANYLKGNNFKVVVNLEYFTLFEKDKNFQDTKRKLVIPVKNFNLNIVSRIQRLLFSFINNLINNRYFNFLTKSTLKKYIVVQTGNTFNKQKIGKWNQFDGYWKDIEIIEYSINYIIESISKNKIIEKGFNNKIEAGSTLLHVRRGDFLNHNRELTENFYKKSLSIAKEKIENFNYEIFTDDYEWVSSKSFFKDAKNIYYQESSDDDIKETIETFSEMLNYENYIVGNSSYSLWAALLSANSSSLVIVPDPWFRHDEHPVLKRKNWISVENS